MAVVLAAVDVLPETAPAALEEEAEAEVTVLETAEEEAVWTLAAYWVRVKAKMELTSDLCVHKTRQK